MASELFNKIISIASDESGYSAEAIIGNGHSCELSDARTIIIHALYTKIGYNMPKIGRLMHLSVAGVSYLISRMGIRRSQSYSFNDLLKRIERRISREILDTC